MSNREAAWDSICTICSALLTITLVVCEIIGSICEGAIMASFIDDL